MDIIIINRNKSSKIPLFDENGNRVLETETLNDVNGETIKK